MTDRTAVAHADPRLGDHACLDAESRACGVPLLSFEGIWRHWGRGRDRWAVLRDINLQLPPGTAACVRGCNGAGKTTLLRIATGILAADRGTVTVDQLTAAHSWREYHRRIGFVSAGDRGLYARVSVRGHLEYFAAQLFVPRAERERVVAASLEQFGLLELAQRRADRLYQGQRQRLRIAASLMHSPRVLLLDEPRNSLDGDGLETLNGAVSELVAGGGAVIWCAPAGEDQAFPFDQMWVIEDGTLVAE